MHQPHDVNGSCHISRRKPMCFQNLCGDSWGQPSGKPAIMVWVARPVLATITGHLTIPLCLLRGHCGTVTGPRCWEDQETQQGVRCVLVLGKAQRLSSVTSVMLCLLPVVACGATRIEFIWTLCPTGAPFVGRGLPNQTITRDTWTCTTIF